MLKTAERTNQKTDMRLESPRLLESVRQMCVVRKARKYIEQEDCQQECLVTIDELV